MRIQGALAAGIHALKLGEFVLVPQRDRHGLNTTVKVSRQTGCVDGLVGIDFEFLQSLNGLFSGMSCAFAFALKPVIPAGHTGWTLDWSSTDAGFCGGTPYDLPPGRKHQAEAGTFGAKVVTARDDQMRISTGIRIKALSLVGAGWPVYMCPITTVLVSASRSDTLHLTG